MRIAILHYSKPPIIGGVERVIGEQEAALTAMGHEVCVFDRSADALVRFNAWLEECGRPRPQSSEADGGIRAPGPFARVRQWIEQDDHHPYFEPAKEITRHRHVLPHWQQMGKLVFVTWRLADSLPQEKLVELREQKRQWEEDHPKPWSAAEEFAFHDQFDGQIERWLNAGMGSCVLQRPEVRQGLIDTLHHADGQDYDLLSYVVMPNHVHVIFRLRAGAELEMVIQAWKIISSRRIARHTGQKGEWWQEGYRDRLIRGPEHLEGVLNYIRRNPVEAKLGTGRFEWWECGRPRPQSSKADGGVRAPQRSVVIVHNVFTMPFDLAWTEELIALTHSRPDIRWINWVHDVRWTEKVPRAVHVAVSQVRRQEYADATGLAGQDIVVIPNGINVARTLGLADRVVAEMEAGAWCMKDLILLSPSRLVRRKNLELGLQVTAELRAQGVQPLLIITGAPDPHQADGRLYFDELKELARNLQIEGSVCFLGESQPVSDDDLRNLYLISDALFFPSHSEGFGLPLLEAVLHRLPVWCSDIPVHREVLGAAASYFPLDAGAVAIASMLDKWYRDSPGVRHEVWRNCDMLKICKECLEPLLPAANERL